MESKAFRVGGYCILFHLDCIVNHLMLAGKEVMINKAVAFRTIFCLKKKEKRTKKVWKKERKKKKSQKERKNLMYFD